MTFNPAPLDAAEVLSPDWLTIALGRPVSTVTEVWRQENVATKIRFTADDEALCVKGYFGPSSAAFIATGSREARFYSELAPMLPLQTPACVYTGIDPETKHGVVIMRDLVPEGTTFLTALSPYSSDQVAATLEQLAAMHAATWDSAPLQSLPWVAPLFESYANVLPDEELAALVNGPRKEGIPEEVRQPKRIKGALGALARRYAGQPSCLVHADAHAGNLYESADGRPGLIDWATYQLVHWSFDVAYHVGAVLEPEQRAASERDLLAHYLDHRAALGVPAPPFDDAWADFRAALAYGYFMWAITRRVEERVMLTFNRRLGTAVTDHDSYALLGV